MLYVYYNTYVCIYIFTKIDKKESYKLATKNWAKIFNTLLRHDYDFLSLRVSEYFG